MILTECKEGDTTLIPRITLTPTDNVNPPVNTAKAISYKHLFCHDVQLTKIKGSLCYM